MEIYPFDGDDIGNGTSVDRFNINYLLFYDNDGDNTTYASGTGTPNSTNSSYYGNGTYIIVRGDSMYPSGYSMPHIILASIVVTLLMIVVVVGNMLVIIAIATEKALKNIQNWFIASLAVADFFLGLVIMPFSLANEIMGYWIFGNWWCDIHSAMDVLLCTASIMNLCLISLDRYWSITQAVDYLKKRTPVRAAIMITLVWILSGLICIPPLLGWKVDRPIEEFPKCQLSEDIGYVLYSALGSFYIPSCIMVFVYIRIYFAAKARARRGIRKQPRPKHPPEEKCTSFSTIPGKGGATSSTTATGSTNADNSSAKRTGASGDVNSNSPMRNVVVEGGVTLEHGGIATIVTQPPQPMAIPIVTCDFASDISTSDNAEGTTGQENGDGGYLDAPKDTLKVMGTASPMPKHPLQACQFRGSTLSVNGDLAQQQAAMQRCRAPSVGIDTDMVSEFDPSSSDSGVVSRCAVVKPLKLRLCQPIFGRRTTSKAKREVIDMGKVSPGHGTQPGNDSAIAESIPRIQKPRDPEREKRRIARKKEKRATLILGLIMGSFIACWLPFFFLYILTPMCSWCQIPDQAFAIAFWLGYMNSALNPVIYTIFNKDFRRAFRRILFK